MIFSNYRPCTSHGTRCIVATSAAAIFMALNLQSAHAGSFNVTYPTPTYSGTVDGQSVGVTLNEYQTQANVFSAIEPTLQSASITGTFTVTYTWVPNGTNDPAPTTLYFEPFSFSWGRNNTQVIYTGAVANDGYGDAVNSHGISQGSHPISVVGGVAQVTVTLSASFTNTGSGGPFQALASIGLPCNWSLSW